MAYRHGNTKECFEQNALFIFRNLQHDRILTINEQSRLASKNPKEHHLSFGCR